MKSADTVSQMSRSQEFGFFIENLVRTEIHSLPPKANDTCVHDITAAENSFDHEETQSIKTCKGNSIDCGDVLRLFDYDHSKKHVMLVFQYEQTATGRCIKRSVILKMNDEFHRVLFGTATRSQIEELVTYVKGIPKHGRTAEHQATYKKMAGDLTKSSGGWISYAPKCDSTTQRRVQCSIRRLDAFLKDYPQLVESDTKGCEVRGRAMAANHDGFLSRARNSK